MRRPLTAALLLASLCACERQSASPATSEPASPEAMTAAAKTEGQRGVAADDKPLAEASASPEAPPPPEAHRGKSKADKDEAYAEEPSGDGRLAAPGSGYGGQAGPVRAGEWDDNANYREFMGYLTSQSSLSFHSIDLKHRRFLVVRDSEGRPVPNCRVSVSDGTEEVSLVTAASGRALLFPHAEGLQGNELDASARCGNAKAEKHFTLGASDGMVDLQLDEKRPALKTVDVELAFILDTTGSMGEEIEAVKSTIDKVAADLGKREVNVRIALVEYKDRSDPFTTKVYPFTTDLKSFRSSVSDLRASGGGDIPEDAVAGLHAALHDLSWSNTAVARLAFVIGDAPPHLDYQSGTAYESDVRAAAHRGIKIHTVAASGMDALGQAVWRQIAQYTGGSNLFVMRGGAGPQSTGGGDPKSSCGGTQENFTSGNLDQLILAKVQSEISALDANPVRIPGLGEDENAKPCDQRITFKQ